jgi:predicted nuclease of restriction endonuclease-like RecB superfamily
MPERTLSPSYLDVRDHLWLSALLDEYHRFAGRRRGELEARLREPLRVACARDRQRRAQHVLDRLCEPVATSASTPARVREVLFAAAADRAPRDEVLGRAAALLDCTSLDIDATLFADLPAERLLPPPPAGLDAGELALRTNLLLVQSLLSRAVELRISIWGNARDIVRSAQLRGLLCVVHGGPSGAADAVLEISGPLSIFRRTRVYGRALASLVPRLVWCDRFELHAECVLGRQRRTLRVRSGDPIFPADPPKRFDSKLELRFARDFARAAPDWELTREPAPVAAADRLLFPDFSLVHRRDPSRRALLEIVGFWTPAYLADKLARIRDAGLGEIILCIDESLNCTDRDLPQGARVVYVRRRIDPAAVLKLIAPEP